MVEEHAYPSAFALIRVGLEHHLVDRLVFQPETTRTARGRFW